MTIFVLLVIIVMIVSGTLIVYQTRSYEYNFIESDLRSTAVSIVQSVRSDQPVTEILADIIEVISGNEASLKGKKVFVLDDSGNIVYTQSPGTKEKGFHTAQVMAALSNNQSDEFEEKTLAGEEVKYISYARSIVKNNDVVYVIYILASTQQVQEKISNMVEVIIVAVLLAIFLSILLSFIFSSFLTKPITALSMKAREMAKGRLNNPIDVYSSDEIGELTKNFNKMASSLNNTMDMIASEKNKMETVIIHMTDGILVFDNYGQLIHKNPAAVRMLKLGPVREFDDVFGGRIDESFSALLDEAEYKPKRILITLGEAYISLDFAKYIDKDGTALGLISVIQDITEHKKLENMQKEFVANVSHELRTPLTTIKSYAETLLEGALDDVEVAGSFLSVINNESDRMTALVKDLLELSRLDNKKTELEEDVLDLAKLVVHSVENYRIHAAKKNQELTMEGVDTERLIIGDGNRLEQVIKNLLSNAVKYSGEGASVHLRLTTLRKYHVLSVIDNGMGMPEEDLPHIFDRFYRVDKARSRAMGGTGLGLAIAKEIIERHGGKIEVKSRVNVGTTFILYFPVYVEETAEEFANAGR